jgi:hypothetical protein
MTTRTASTHRTDPIPIDPVPIDLSRRATMFQARYADLARVHRTRRQRELQRRLEVQAQRDQSLATPRMLAR